MKTPEVSGSTAVKLALTRAEAAVALGVSRITIDRLTQRRILNPSRATRRPLFAVSELERFLRETKGEFQPPLSNCPHCRRVCVESSCGQLNMQRKEQTHEVTGAHPPCSATKATTAGGAPISARTFLPL